LVLAAGGIGDGESVVAALQRLVDPLRRLVQAARCREGSMKAP
jgi:NAD(P)H-dependent flavin oxidoreductase YrpB (nitropropane dioxygenase family)